MAPSKQQSSKKASKPAAKKSASKAAPHIESKGGQRAGRVKFKTYARMRPQHRWAAAIAPGGSKTPQEWDAWIAQQLAAKA